MYSLISTPQNEFGRQTMKVEVDVNRSSVYDSLKDYDLESPIVVRQNKYEASDKK